MHPSSSRFAPQATPAAGAAAVVEDSASSRLCNLHHLYLRTAHKHHRQLRCHLRRHPRMSWRQCRRRSTNTRHQSQHQRQQHQQQRGRRWRQQGHWPQRVLVVVAGCSSLFFMRSLPESESEALRQQPRRRDAPQRRHANLQPRTQGHRGVTPRAPDSAPSGRRIGPNEALRRRFRTRPASAPPSGVGCA